MIDFEKLAADRSLWGEDDRRAAVREAPPPPPVWLADIDRVERRFGIWALVSAIGGRLVIYEVEAVNTSEMYAAIDEICRRWLERSAR